MPACLDRVGRAALAHALECSEHPETMRSRDEVLAARRALKAAAEALCRLDVLAFAASPLCAEMARRMSLLAARLDAIKKGERRRITAQVLALAIVGQAAGHPVTPRGGDKLRSPRTGKPGRQIGA